MKWNICLEHNWNTFELPFAEKLNTVYTFAYWFYANDIQTLVLSWSSVSVTIWIEITQKGGNSKNS